MNRITLLIIFLLTFAAGKAQQSSNEYEPTTNWPFLMKDFYDGTIVLAKDSICDTKLNYHLRSEALYCIDPNGKVARVLFPDMQCVVISNIIYRFVNGKLMLQLHAEDDAMLMDHAYIDFDRMEAGYTQGHALYARNTSETSMVANVNGHPILHTLHMKGENNESYANLRETWFDGQKLPIRHTNYFVLKGKTIKALQKECNDLLSKDKQKQLKALVKTNKLKWTRKEDLITILRFMKTAM